MFRGPPIQPSYCQLYAHTRQIGHDQCPTVQHRSSENETQNCCIQHCLQETMTQIYAIISRNQLGLISRGYLYANGHKNAENIGYQSADNPRLTYEMPLHDITVGVWCTVSLIEMPRPILSSDTINTKRCTLLTH